MSKGQEVMRAEFEVWAKRTLGGDRRTNDRGEYINEDWEYPWWAWQAARQQAPAEHAANAAQQTYQKLSILDHAVAAYASNNSAGPASAIAAQDQSARIAELETVLEEAHYRIGQGRIWNGTSWTLTGMHSSQQQKVLDIIDAALAKHGEA